MTVEARKIRLLMALRRNGVTDTRVLAAIERIPRERFVPEPFQDQAWEDTALPIDLGQTISQPLIVALMTQALELGERQTVLEIGTGSGYQAAVLSRLCRRVYTVERLRPLLTEAEARFQALRLNNITTRHGDGTKGWPEQAPFERILVTAAGGPDAPKDLTDQLAVGGVMVIPLGDDYRGQRVVRIRRTETGLTREDLWPVRFVPLLSDPPSPPGTE
ncbi:protein-L-isoaspartate(D-aspartate) O-methyltransferase [Azospirillum brasilense]|uniref:Protein-L-isoaspartate O-methyltransferase n=1 Tax=Azospirillum brasilense TaxID=192 RepID=A0A0P0ERV9_AZOBR|nr:MULTISPECIES: protein-L-isoaspartate(D-aspartate) O-methyltransferase [Azospirillum]ALJ37166.1 protein-L-isoaspartate O-methyltransferase [Azospirillum brasilense]MDW7551867.1 protein-L-isoaspartate(D-aspartate) O-methyltransferase [Azospirillum brasilense]MDW7591302.1 protein-L-isoaspartate(D-aspartate) O-methyltransferase [Azospirillum brasilense]MDW7626472.1 protein-L-isoaspartate(D-aspartate) O-methyltransferase [Azospirillum brasilense]MDX5951179.1 protein-L-isoaspartate(D-aspartate) O